MKLLNIIPMVRALDGCATSPLALNRIVTLSLTPARIHLVRLRLIFAFLRIIVFQVYFLIMLRKRIINIVYRVHLSREHVMVILQVC